MELVISFLHKRFAASDGVAEFQLSISSVSFPLGSIVYLLGRNGTGKSVFLRTLCGDLHADKRGVYFTNGGSSKIDAGQRLPFVRQRAEDNLALALSVQENAVLHLPINGVLDGISPLSRKRQSIDSVLQQYPELNRKATQLAYDLSVGQRQILAFACATAHSSRVLCLDEFLASADPHTATLLRQRARAYAAETPSCVIIASHDLHQAIEDADKILVLENGRIRYDIVPGSPMWSAASILEIMKRAPDKN